MSSNQSEAAPCRQAGLSTDQIVLLVIGLFLAIAIVTAAIILAKRI